MELSLEQGCRDFVTQHQRGMLSTHSARYPRYPMSSVAPYDIDRSGRIVLYISLISEHYKNISENHHAALLVSDPFGYHDPHAFSRASLLLDFEVVAKDDSADILSSYEGRFPNSVHYEIAHNFVIVRGTPKHVRWIADFGNMGWIDGDTFSETEPDILSYKAMSAIEHMNLDHSDALIDLVKGFGGDRYRDLPKGIEVRMISLSSLGFQVSVRSESKHSRLFIRFQESLTADDQVRPAVIALLKDARARIAQT